jgi:exonuclease III
METFSQALLEHDPDVICLQEATHDGKSFYETLLPGYVCLGEASAHVEYAMIFVRESLAARANPIKLADS